jgi:hypothetical protein
MSAVAVPEQIPTCGCSPNDSEHDACNGESYYCNACGQSAEEPMPYAEPMDAPRLDLAKASSWFWYCKACGLEWLRDGAPVVAVRMVVSGSGRA